MSAANADVDARLSMVDLPARQDIVLFVSLVDSKLAALRNGEPVQPASNTSRWGLKRTAGEAPFCVIFAFFFFFHRTYYTFYNPVISLAGIATRDHHRDIGRKLGTGCASQRSEGGASALHRCRRADVAGGVTHVDRVVSRAMTASDFSGGQQYLAAVWGRLSLV